MRQTHVGGDKLFVDCAGDTVPVIVQVMLIHVNSAKEPCHHAFAPQSVGCSARAPAVAPD
jgi:hypothetical protein